LSKISKPLFSNFSVNPGPKRRKNRNNRRGQGRDVQEGGFFIFGRRGGVGARRDEDDQ
jgi:hypothetical protein